MLHHVRLYRIDAFWLSFLAVLFGGLASDAFNTAHVLLGLLTAALSMNFVYVYNAVYDLEADALNKPERLLPRGVVSKKSAKRYALLLFVLSLIWPWLIVYLADGVKVASFLLLLLGIVYSHPFFKVRKNGFVTMVVAAGIWSCAFATGYLTSWNAEPQRLMIFFCFCLGVFPLKDISDVDGDRAAGYSNVVGQYGMSRVIGFSVVCFLACIAGTWMISETALSKGLLTIGCLVPVVWIAALYFNRVAPQLIYKNMLRTLMAIGPVLFFIDWWQG